VDIWSLQRHTRTSTRRRNAGFFVAGSGCFCGEKEPGSVTLTNTKVKRIMPPRSLPYPSFSSSFFQRPSKEKPSSVQQEKTFLLFVSFLFFPFFFLITEISSSPRSFLFHSSICAHSYFFSTPHCHHHHHFFLLSERETRTRTYNSATETSNDKTSPTHHPKKGGFLPSPIKNCCLLVCLFISLVVLDVPEILGHGDDATSL